MGVTTGTGDRGKTSLFSGERVRKDDRRIEAVGDVDELSSALGVAAALLESRHPALAAELQSVQSELFRLGAWIAVIPGSSAEDLLPPLSDAPREALESAIRRMESELTALRGFILPGGCLEAAWIHMARAVCRRAERRVVGLAEPTAESSDPLEKTLSYLNRLSDYLFVLARTCNRLESVPDVPWKP